MLIRILKYFFETCLKFMYFKKNITLKNNQNILFFNTHDIGGGAAKICLQLFESNNCSKMYVLVKRSSNKNIIEIDPNLWNRLGTLARYIERKLVLLDFGKIGVISLLKSKDYQHASIIHLHNTHGSYLSFIGLELLMRDKKVVWTLHDEYLLTGHCSFSIGCNKWVTGCKYCPDLTIYPALVKDSTALNQQEKMRLLLKLQPYIVVPSNWLAKRVKIRYPFLKNLKVIPNGVDTSIFKPLSSSEKDIIKDEYGIQKNKHIILFIAELSTKNPFKGGDVLLEIIKSFEAYPEFIFITIGGGEVNSFHNVVNLPYISNDFKLSNLYNIADLMLYPTKADNLPLVILEAMACGIPVIANNIAGISEIITHNESGYLIENNVVNLYIEKIKHHFFQEENLRLIMSKRACETIKTNFDLKKMIKSYTDLYTKI